MSSQPAPAASQDGQLWGNQRIPGRLIKHRSSGGLFIPQVFSIWRSYQAGPFWLALRLTMLLSRERLLPRVIRPSRRPDVDAAYAALGPSPFICEDLGAYSCCPSMPDRFPGMSVNQFAIRLHTPHQLQEVYWCTWYP